MNNVLFCIFICKVNRSLYYSDLVALNYLTNLFLEDFKYMLKFVFECTNSWLIDCYLADPMYNICLGKLK